MTAPRWRQVLRFWGPDVAGDVDDELRFHLEACAADLVARGHPPDDAWRLARARFGDVDRVRGWMLAHDHAQHRRARRAEHVETLAQDVRYAARRLRQGPGFALAVVLVLALGIGAATAMFSAVDAAFLRPLPFQRDDRLVRLADVAVPTREFRRPTKTSPELADVQALRAVFSHAAAYAPGGLNLTGGGEPARVRVALVSRDFFATLGVRPARGRVFTSEETSPDGPRVALLSDGLWRRAFGGDPGVVGRDVRLNDVPHRVVGVMPAGLAFPSETELWLPMPVPMSTNRWEAFRQYMPTVVVARLAPGVEARAAGQRMRAIRQALRPPAAGEPPPPADSLAVPLRDTLVGKRRGALLVLFGATALVLLVACANAANLLLSRAAARQGEIALRATLGATRARLVRQLLVESLLLALAGAALGVALAYASLGALSALMPPTLVGTAPPRVDLRVLGFSLLLALVTGLGFGLWPALGASRADAGETVRGAAGGTGTRAAVGVRRSLVVAELAMALMLAVGAGLMLRSFQALLGTDLGVRPDGVATLELALPAARYATVAERRRFFDAVLARLAATPGIEAAAFVNNLPLSPNGGVSISVRPLGRTPAEAEALPYAGNNVVSRDYFRAAGIPLLRGRTFGPASDSASLREVVVSAGMARAYWPGADAVGQRLVAFHDTQVVVGVAGDVRGFTVDREATPQMYEPIARGGAADVALVARGDLPAAVVGRHLRDAVRAADPGQAVFNVRPMRDVVGRSLAPQRANALLITTFGLVALALAGVGVYGVVAFAVAQRTREIGIRMALGALPADVLRVVLRDGVRLALTGVALGLAGAWALRRVLAGLLYGVTPADPVAFGSAAVVLFGLAVAATLVPARQATRVDPARTIRGE